MSEIPKGITPENITLAEAAVNTLRCLIPGLVLAATGLIPYSILKRLEHTGNASGAFLKTPKQKHSQPQVFRY